MSKDKHDKQTVDMFDREFIKDSEHIFHITLEYNNSVKATVIDNVVHKQRGYSNLRVEYCDDNTIVIRGYN